MAIVADGDSVRVEYSIPEAVDADIPDYFYFAMAGELCSIFGPHVFDKIDPEDGSDPYYDLDTGTAGWYEAFHGTCCKLGMLQLFEYWTSLPWYDSDIFDSIIEQRIIEKFISAEDHRCNPYYKYLVASKCFAGYVANAMKEGSSK